jgi:hypothetical protein
VTIHWKALDEHFLMVQLVFWSTHFLGENVFSEFFSKTPWSWTLSLPHPVRTGSRDPAPWPTTMRNTKYFCQFDLLARIRFKPGLVCPTDKRWQHLPLPIDDPIVRKGIPHLFYIDFILYRFIFWVRSASGGPGWYWVWARLILGVGPGYRWTSKPCGSERVKGWSGGY